MATLGTSTTQPLELFVTKNALGLYDISDKAISATSIRYSAIALTKRESLIAAALNGLCAKGEGSNPSLATMAIKCADDLVKALEVGK